MLFDQAIHSCRFSRRFYKSPKRWQEILAANKKSIRDPKKTHGWQDPGYSVEALGCRGAQLSREPLFLKLHREGYCAAKIGHIVIENALVRLACCQRADGAHRQKFIHAIIRG